jgi:uncharacterized protein YegJ (DUF2314 family)
VPVPSLEADRCVACEHDSSATLTPICATCLAAQRATLIAVTPQDREQGYTIASRARMESFRRKLVHPLPALRAGRSAKLGFVTVPLREDQHIESMWVTIEGREGETWRGHLDNEPRVVTRLRHGDPVRFVDGQVLAVIPDTADTERPGEHICSLCDPELRAAQQELDAADERLLDVVRNHGFMVFRIPPDDEGPGFAFTTGLAHRFDHPELILFGDDAESAGAVLHDLAGQVVTGTRFAAGEQREDIFHDAIARFDGVTTEHERHHREFLGHACWFHRRADFPALQVVWSDPTGVFPDQEGFAAGLRDRQVLLGS